MESKFREPTRSIFSFNGAFLSHPLVDAWITNSKIAKTTLVSLCQVNPKRVSVVYNGLNTTPSDPIELGERTMEVLTVANLNPRKGHLEYLATVKDVVKVIPNVKLVFVGRDDMGGEIQSAIKECEPQITFIV